MAGDDLDRARTFEKSSGCCPDLYPAHPRLLHPYPPSSPANPEHLIKLSRLARTRAFTHPSTCPVRCGPAARGNPAQRTSHTGWKPADQQEGTLPDRVAFGTGSERRNGADPAYTARLGRQKFDMKGRPFVIAAAVQSKGLPRGNKLLEIDMREACPIWKWAERGLAERPRRAVIRP